MENFNVNLGNISLYTYKWKVAEGKNVRGIVQIAHGISEHMGRYEDFARYLNDYGFEVWGHDHPGHGKTGNVKGSSPADAMSTLIGGMAQVKQRIDEDRLGFPVILFGHSMGSFLSIRSCELFPDSYDGMVLCGTTGKFSPLLEAPARQLSKLAVGRKGDEKSEFVLHKMMFKMYNTPIKHKRTDFDWINSLPEEVDRYIQDPNCGHPMDNAFILSLINGLSVYYKNSEIKKIRKNLPILLIGGAEDNLSSKGKGVIKLARQFKEAGMRDIYLRLYEGARHEILLDHSRVDVMNDTLKFIEGVKGVED